jgi:hypothetical protein
MASLTAVSEYLADDTGPSSSDLITADPTLTGTASLTNYFVEVIAGGGGTFLGGLTALRRSPEWP